MKTIAITTVLIASALCHSAASQEPDPFCGETGIVQHEAQKDIMVTTETIELDAATAFAQLRLFQDTHQLRLQLQKLILDGKATVTDTSIIRASSGERSLLQFNHQHSHPSEIDWDPLSMHAHPLSLKNGYFANRRKESLMIGRENYIVHFQFETLNIGTHIEQEAILDGKCIHLKLETTHTHLATPSLQQKAIDKFGYQYLYFPGVKADNTIANLPLSPNIYTLLSMKPTVNDVGNLNNNRLVLTFAKADALKIK